MRRSEAPPQAPDGHDASGKGRHARTELFSVSPSEDNRTGRNARRVSEQGGSWGGQHRMNAALRLFAPGPVAVHERVRAALGAPVLHHRSPEFKRIFAKAREMLRRVWQTPGWEPLIFTSSGTGAMEGAVANFM